ncbi:hypothetical protein LJ655_12605 [Paraburkholderia sp. MMS20-SJTN17]|uniref:Uncharacterized protein n=1 Tax=Paraburkholderia translucens TaxID=2886945 RepID=A0ABS8KDB6_9BURK|nr:hypothetical protein [Paraburkholderia sp. MMS20-SJTN17]MCC8402718.1 hypothetical protein [Paraburkholderia sp. MMS20-SJTN17]
MDDLIDFAVDAAGGMDRFRNFRSVSAQLHEQCVSHTSFAPTNNYSVYTPSRVGIRRDDGSVASGSIRAQPKTRHCRGR